MLQQIDDVPDEFIYRMVRHTNSQITRVAQQRPDTPRVVIVIDARRRIEIGEGSLAVRTLSVLRPHQELVCMGANAVTAQPSIGDDGVLVVAIALLLGIRVTHFAATVVAGRLPRIAGKIHVRLNFLAAGAALKQKDLRVRYSHALIALRSVFNQPAAAAPLRLHRQMAPRPLLRGIHRSG